MSEETKPATSRIAWVSRIAGAASCCSCMLAAASAVSGGSARRSVRPGPSLLQIRRGAHGRSLMGCLGAKGAHSWTFFRRCRIGRLPESNLHLALPAAAPFPLGQLPAGGASAPHGFLLCSRAILCTAGARGQRVGDASGDRLAVCPPRLTCSQATRRPSSAAKWRQVVVRCRRGEQQRRGESVLSAFVACGGCGAGSCPHQDTNRNALRPAPLQNGCSDRSQSIHSAGAWELL